MTVSRSSIADTVKDIVDDQLKLSHHGYQLTLEDDLWNLGMTSLNSVGVMLAIEDAFGIEFAESALNEETFRSVDSIAAAVERALDQSVPVVDLTTTSASGNVKGHAAPG